MSDIDRIQKAILEENLDGWLFFHFRGRDPLTMRILGLSPGAISTRPAYYFVPAHGTPRKIVHVIEPGVFEGLPGDTTVYSTRLELLDALGALPRGRVAVQFSEELPIVSFLDLGTARTLESKGLELHSSASLIQRTVGILDEAGFASHERAAAHLYEIVDVVWRRVRESFSAGRPLTEGEVQGWISAEIDSRDLVADHGAIVACAAHSGDPHYEPPAGGGSRLTGGEVLQLDLWAKERGPASIYADISWVAFLGEKPPEEVAGSFSKLCAARDRGVSLVNERLAEGAPVSGYEVDEAVRAVLIEAGFADAIRHRTGHSIDTEDHGSGVNLDSVEFPDHRLIIDGACFSIEPGIYFASWGLRTEINLYIRNGRAHVSGGSPQQELLTFS